MVSEPGVDSAISVEPEKLLSTPDAGWPERFAELADQIRGVMGADVVEIEHIGSTAVPGLPARPVIDALVAVDAEDIADPFEMASIAHSLARIGFVPVHGAPGAPLFLQRRSHEAGFDADVWVDHLASRRYEGHIALRDCLRSRPEIAKAFSELKQESATVFHEDPEIYAAAKDAFMREAVRLCSAERPPA